MLRTACTPEPTRFQGQVLILWTLWRQEEREDPGCVEGNVVFALLGAFDPDASGLQVLKAQYRRGGLGDNAVKRRLEELLQEQLCPIRHERLRLQADRAQVLAMLKEGPSGHASVRKRPCVRSDARSA